MEYWRLSLAWAGACALGLHESGAAEVRQNADAVATAPAGGLARGLLREAEIENLPG